MVSHLIKVHNVFCWVCKDKLTTQLNHLFLCWYIRDNGVKMYVFKSSKYLNSPHCAKH